MGVTFLQWTDRSAGTIQKVTELCGKRWKWEIEVTADKAIRTDRNGLSEDQSYVFEQQPNAPREVYRCKREGGEWVRVEQSDKSPKMVISRGPGLRIGERDAYRDPSF